MVNKVTKITPCAWPYCKSEGKFPAPCDPRDLKKRILLCQEHVILYNKRWNGLDGFDAEEIFNMQMNPAWDKPTWKLGEKQKMNEAIFNFTHSSDKKFKGHDFFSDEVDEEYAKYAMARNLSMPQEIYESMELLNIEEPLELIKLKKAYKKQVKENHPDRVKNKIKAEDDLKQINLAYHRLRKYLKLKIPK